MEVLGCSDRLIALVRKEIQTFPFVSVCQTTSRSYYISQLFRVKNFTFSGVMYEDTSNGKMLLLLELVPFKRITQLYI